MAMTWRWRVAAMIPLVFVLVLGITEQVGAVHAGLHAQIQRGTCAEPGETIAEIALGYREPVLGTPAATPTGTFTQPDPQAALPVVTGSTTIDVPLDQLTASLHSVSILLASAEGDEPPIRLACGVIGGVPAGDDLVFGLQSLGAAEACTTGIGWLHALDGQTRVVVFVSQGLCPEETALAATPPAGTPAP